MTANLQKPIVPNTAADSAKLGASEKSQLTKETTNIIDNAGKRVFAHSIPMSSFVFTSGKVINFRGGLYGTADEQEIKELLATCAISSLISEADANGIALYSSEDRMRELAAKVLG